MKKRRSNRVANVNIEIFRSYKHKYYRIVWLLKLRYSVILRVVASMRVNIPSLISLITVDNRSRNLDSRNDLYFSNLNKIDTAFIARSER